MPMPMTATKNDATIECPKCHHSFAIADSVEKKVRDQLHDEFAKKESSIRAEAREAADEAQRIMNERVEEVRAESKKETAKLAAEKLGIEKEIAKRIEAAKESLKTAARSEASAELESVRHELDSTSTKLRDAQTKELELRKAQRELESAKAEFELVAARKLDEEREKIRADVEGKVGQAHELKALEWQKKQGDMEKLIDELRKKSEQGSSQLQGEVLELAIEDALRDAFPSDSIEPVAKGVKGGDTLQRVVTRTGQSAGSILYEIKRTKVFSDAWSQKLKDNQRAAKADTAVIVTTALPEGVAHVGIVDGVWVTDLQSFPGLALALRTSLVDLAQARGAAVGKNEKMESLYSYLSGSEFRGRVEAIVEAFTTMKEDLESEKRAIEKSWAKREKSLTRVITSTTGMHGDLAGIIGSALQDISALTLEGKA